MHEKPKTTPRMRGTTPEIHTSAQEMRWRLTPAEAVLWEALKSRRLDGLKFRRQHPVGPFILDFWCPSARLVVEVDGPIHNHPDEIVRDAARAEQLESYGYRMLRCTIDEVLDHLPAVLDRIRTVAGESPDL